MACSGWLSFLSDPLRKSNLGHEYQALKGRGMIYAFPEGPEISRPFYENFMKNFTIKPPGECNHHMPTLIKLIHGGRISTTFHDKLHDFSRLVPSIILGATGHHPKTYDNSTTLHDKFHDFSTPHPPRKIRLLSPRLYKGSPDQAAPVFGAGSKFMGAGGL
jgi:hypothetical protein